MLFLSESEPIPVSKIMGFSAKQAGMVIPEPTQTVYRNWAVLRVVTGHFIAALQGSTEFRPRDQVQILKYGRGEI